MKNSKRYSIILGLFIIIGLTMILYFLTRNYTIKEGAESWSPETENNFLDAFNKNNQLNPGGMTMDNVKEYEKNITENDAKYYINNGEFKYDSGWTNAYVDSIASTVPLEFTKKYVVQYSTRQGAIVFPLTTDQAKQARPKIPSCRIDANGNLVGNSMYMFDKDGNDKPVPNTDLPSEIPGFAFVNSPCNPCDLLSSTPKYDCPFSLKDAKGNTAPTHSMLQYLWKLGKYASGSAPASAPVPAPASESSNKSSSSWF